MTVLRWAIFLSLIAFAYAARVVFVPIFLSVFLAMLLEPIVASMVERGLPRQRAATLVVTFFVFVAAVGMWGLYLSSVSLVNDLAISPRVAAVVDYLRRTAGDFETSTKTLLPLTHPLIDRVQKVEIVQAYPGWLGFLFSGFGSLFEAFSVAIFVPLLLFYFLFDKENLVESLNIILGESLYIPTLNSDLPKMIRAFFVANLVTVLGLIATHAIGLYLLGFENWLPLAVISGFLNVLPIVGAPLAILIPVAMGILPAGTEFPFIGMAIVTLVLHFVFNNLLLPILIGSRININTASLAIGLLFWSWLWGGIGFLIAIPMTALIKIFLESNSSTLAIANLMSARPTALLGDTADELTV